MTYLTNAFRTKRLMILALVVLFACKKEFPGNPEACLTDHKAEGHIKQTKTFSSEVAIKWLDMKNRLIQQPGQLRKPGFADQYQDRYFAYVGITLYEAVVPGMPSYQSLAGQLTDMPAMPQTDRSKAYHWAASANAAMAFIHKGLLYSITAENKTAVDSLEQALYASYQAEVDAATLERSIDFGREVARRILAWSETDGAFAIYPPYTTPVGPGLWVPTPPNFTAATLVHYGDLRPLMPGVLKATLAPPPLAYSTDPTSLFFKMEKEVYEVSQALTQDQIAEASYWRANVQNWFAILKKVLIKQSATLDIAALADCKMGIAVFDAAIAGWKTKYTYNVLRPITYIRNVLGYSNWNSLFPANANPDYPDALVPDYAACAGAMISVFGDHYSFKINELRQSFHSFSEAALQAGESRFFAGVTTKPFVATGLDIGFKTVAYMDNHIQFIK